jgi:hypothetical protein
VAVNRLRRERDREREIEKQRKSREEKEEADFIFCFNFHFRVSCPLFSHLVCVTWRHLASREITYLPFQLRRGTRRILEPILYMNAS